MNVEGEGYRWDLIRPCAHCPFRSDEGRITFRGRDRAAEIEEGAYRQGFVCHEHAETFEDDYSDESRIGPRLDGTSQHCAGALLMYLAGGGGGNVPFERLSWAKQSHVLDRIDWQASVFESPEEFIDANHEDNSNSEEQTS